jgi:hypothetical protein
LISSAWSKPNSMDQDTGLIGVRSMFPSPYSGVVAAGIAALPVGIRPGLAIHRSARAG